MKAPIFIIIVSLSLTALQCEVFLDDVPNCEKSLEVFYETCTYVFNDEPISEYDAIDLCEYAQDDAKETHCTEAHIKWRVCLYRTEPEVCGCDEEMTDLFECINTGYEEQTEDNYYESY